MTTDPIADLLTRIRNASTSRKESLNIDFSKAKIGILKVLKNKGFISEFTVTESGKFPEIKIDLNTEKGKLNLKRISKPGQRIYVGTQNIKKIHGGLGVAIYSTPKGIMSGEEAQKMKIGGELICEVF